MRQIMEASLLLSRFLAFYAFGVVINYTNNQFFSLILFFVVFNAGTMLHFLVYQNLKLNLLSKWRNSDVFCNNVMIFVFPLLFFVIPNFPLIHLFILSPVCAFFLAGTFFVSMILVLIDRRIHP